MCVHHLDDDVAMAPSDAHDDGQQVQTIDGWMDGTLDGVCGVMFQLSVLDEILSFCKLLLDHAQRIMQQQQQQQLEEDEEE